MTPPPHLITVALVASTDRKRIQPILDALHQAGVAVANSSDAADPAAPLVFFASGESTAPERLVFKAAVDARCASRPMIAVVLDDVGESVVGPWNLPTVLDARTMTPIVLANALRSLLPATSVQPIRKMPARPKAFISFAGADYPFVQRLTAWLLTQGWDWWEYKSSERDRRYKLDRELGESIAQSTAVLFVLTQDWMGSDHCLDELDTTAAQRKPAEYLYVRHCDLTAIEHNKYSAGALRIDFTTDEQAAFRILADRLRQLRG